jgi:hypothetical protein
MAKKQQPVKEVVKVDKPTTDTGLVKETTVPAAVDASSAASAKKAMDEIDSIQSEKAGVPEDIEEQVKKRFLQVLSEKRTNLTGPNMADDWCWLPETIDVPRTGERRHIVKHVDMFGEFRFMTADGQYFLRWCHEGRFDRHRRRGYTFVRYDDMFKDTDFFQRTTDNRVRNGDLYLMKVSVDGFARLQRDKLELKRIYERYHEGEVTEAAEKHGTKSFRHYDDGSIEFIN